MTSPTDTCGTTSEFEWRRDVETRVINLSFYPEARPWKKLFTPINVIAKNLETFSGAILNVSQFISFRPHSPEVAGF
jgi:hypothetical protein